MFKNILSIVNRDLNDLVSGEDIVSIYKSDNLLKDSKHEQVGFFKTKVLDDSTFKLLKDKLTSFVKFRVEKLLGKEIPGFTLEKYHSYIVNDEDHSKIATWELEVNILSGIEEKIRSNIIESINAQLKLKRILIENNLQEIIGFRIVRPNKGDENPFHRDSWMKQWENSLNVWIPVAGCNNCNSLVVVKGSHLWNESKICRTNNGSVYNNKKFKVSAAISTDYEVDLYVPNPQYGEALVFSPHLIHGNALNNMPDTTRVSIELRYERV